MRDLTNDTLPEEVREGTVETLDYEKERKDHLERIQEIDLSESCLDDKQKQTFRAMLLRNRQSLAFSMKELGQCKIAPMKIRVDESQGIVSSQLTSI